MCAFTDNVYALKDSAITIGKTVIQNGLNGEVMDYRGAGRIQHFRKGKLVGE